MIGLNSPGCFVGNPGDQWASTQLPWYRTGPQVWICFLYLEATINHYGSYGLSIIRPMMLFLTKKTSPKLGNGMLRSPKVAYQKVKQLILGQVDRGGNMWTSEQSQLPLTQEYLSGLTGYLRTESKATTVWSMEELSKSLPKLLQSALRNSRYYSKRNDSITIQAQTQRSRTANTDDNRLKLVDELLGIYKQQVPNPTSHESIKKHEAM